MDKVEVKDKRSIFYKVWTKNKNLILVITGLGLGYYAYKKFKK